MLFHHLNRQSFWLGIFTGCAVLCASVAIAHGDVIAISNHSFEVDSVPTNAFTTSGGITDWTGGAQLINGTFGGYNMGGITDNPDGTDQATWSNAADIYQVTGAQLTAGEIYTLTVDIGERPDSNLGSSGRIRLGVGSTFATDVLVPLIPGDDLFTTSDTQNGWITKSVVFRADDQLASYLGQDIRVELLTNGSQVNFDNVRLSSIPEPSSIGVLAVGALVFLKRRSRRN